MKMKMLMTAALGMALPFAAHATVQPSAQCGTNGVICSASADLALSGIVPTRCSIAVKAEDKASHLNIADGESSALVASVTEQTNNLAGYRVTVLSHNNGKLVNPAMPAQGVGYQLSYDGGAMFAPTNSATEVKHTGVLSAAANHVSPVRVTIPAQPAILAGTYADTLTFELASL